MIQVIQEIGWEVIPHLTYSPYFAPSSFYILHSLSNNHWETSFSHDVAFQTWSDEFFISKLQNWEGIVNNEGEYTLD